MAVIINKVLVATFIRFSPDVERSLLNLGGTP